MISLTDNGELERLLEPEEERALAPVLDKTLKDLQSGGLGEKLIIFPHSFLPSPRNGQEKSPCILTRRYEQDEKGQTRVSVKTGNLAGFISCGGVQVSIVSRFSDKDVSGGMQDTFLHYMLQKVLSLNITSLPHRQNREALFDFLPYLFPGMLNRAMQQGLYKEYRREEHNDARLRGSIDVARHLRQNMPFMGKVAYTTREFSHDNPVTQLIRHTIEYLQLHHEHILAANAVCRENVASIIAATPGYAPQERGRLLRQKTRQHPYFSEYGPLQQLCRSILLRETLSYGDNEEEVNGILIDVAWLWEEYLATLLCRQLGYEHPSNTDRIGKIYLDEPVAVDSRDKFGKFERYPDFYLPAATEAGAARVVIDAKYKWEVNPVTDVNQVITYMYRLKAPRGIFLLPAKGKLRFDSSGLPCESSRLDNSMNKSGGEPETDAGDAIQSTERTLLGHGGTLERLRLRIPAQVQEGGFPAFCAAMEAQEKALAEHLSQR